MPHIQWKHPLCRTESLHRSRCGPKEMCFVDPTDLSAQFFRIMTICLARIAEKLGVSRDQCEELAQEGWLRFFYQSEQVRDEVVWKDLCSWLAAVVHNLAVDTIRRRNAVAFDSLEALSMELVDEREVDRANHPEWSECLTAWLARLQREEPENHRLLCQRYLEGRTVAALAAERGWTPHKVSCRLYRAKQKLRSWAMARHSGPVEAS